MRVQDELPPGFERIVEFIDPHSPRIQEVFHLFIAVTLEQRYRCLTINY